MKPKIFQVRDPQGRIYQVREAKNGVISEIIDDKGKSHKVFQTCKRCNKQLTPKEARFFYQDFICNYENAPPESIVDCHTCVKSEINALYNNLKLERKAIFDVLKSRYKNINQGTIFNATNNHPQYRTLEQAKLWARNNKIKTRAQWERYWKKGKLPSDIPRYPHMVYRGKWRNK